MNGTVLVGREQELALLRAEIGRSGAGEARIVFIRGEPGIGKTSLAAAAAAGDPDFQVVAASGEESEQDLAYGVADQLLRRLGADSPEPAGPGPLAVGATLLRALSDLQSRAPILLLVDDLQWADRSSQAAISFAVRRLQADTVCALFCLRSSSEGALTSGLSRLLDSPRATLIDLDGLSASEVGQLAQRERIHLAPRATERLRRHTGGNPLWTLSLLREAPEGLMSPDSTRLPAPRSLSGLTAARMAHLSDEARALVEAAAVSGAAAELGLLATVSAVPHAFAALEEAVDAGFLLSDGGSPPSVRVIHSLVGAAVYDAISPSRRSDLHRAWSRHAMTQFDRLRHEIAASPGHDGALAGRTAAEAAACAAAGAWSEAATLWESAARITPHRDDRLLRLQHSVAAALMGGEVARAAALADTLRSLDVGLASPRSKTLLGWLTMNQGRPVEALPMLEQAVADAVEAGDSQALAEASRLFGHLLIILGRADEAPSHARRALDLDRPGTMESGLSRSILVMALAADGQNEEAEREAGSAGPLVRPNELMVGVSRGTSRLFRGDFAGAVEDLSGVIRASRGVGGFESLCAAWAHLSRAHYCVGDWDASVATSEQAVSVTEDAQQSWAMAAVHSHATYVPARRGHWSRAENHVAEAADAAERSRDAMSISYAATAAAVLRHSRGDFQGVLSALEPVLNLESRVGAFMPGALEWPNLFGEALVRTGRLRQAEEFILDFLGAAERHDSPWAGVAARRALGLVRAAHAAWPLAISLLDEASAIALRAGMPFEAAQTVLERGVARAHAGGPQSGIDDVRSALSTFSELGARPFTDRASTILAALGGRPGARPSVPANALTPQELAVSRLVREGMSNRQIAGELFLSTKTVEFHLRHVYMKLGIHSRTQLVARSAELLDLGGVEDGADRSL